MQLDSITKTYSDFTLGPLNLGLEPGYIHGIAGPNGAGKTTTLKILMGLVRPDSGTVQLLNQEVDQRTGIWKEEIGYIAEDQVFFEGWRGSKNLELMARMRQQFCMDRAEDLANRLHLDLKKRAKDLSKGNRVKLALVAAMAYQPRILILDEPTSGLDPVTRNEVLEILMEYIGDEERAALFSTHIISDLARIADTIAFIKEGTFSCSGAPADITESWRKIRFRFPFEQIDLPGVVSHRVDGKNHLVVTSEHQQTKKILEQAGAMVGDINRVSLDEAAVYILKGDQSCTN